MCQYHPCRELIKRRGRIKLHKLRHADASYPNTQTTFIPLPSFHIGTQSDFLCDHKYAQCITKTLLYRLSSSLSIPVMRLLSFAALLGLLTTSLAHNIQMGAHQRECFHEVLHKDDKMTVTFQVGDREFGGAGNLEIDFWVGGFLARALGKVESYRNNLICCNLPRSPQRVIADISVCSS